MSREEAYLLRADLLQQVKGLELQRAAVLSTISRLEKDYQIERKENGKKITPSDLQQAGSEDTKLLSGGVLSD